MKTQLQQAYCIHSRPYRETSQILELLTLEHGLVSCINKGSKKKNSSVQNSFLPLLVSWVGKGDLYTLTHIESTGTKQITDTYACIIGMYLNELILKLVPKSSPSHEVFNLYRDVIKLLGEDIHKEKILRLFEVELLALIGHGVSLDKEMDHETPITSKKIYRYDVGIGASKVAQYSSVWNVVKGETLLGLQSPLEMHSHYLAEAKQFMRGIINWHLNNRTLYSREILQFMQT